MKQFIAIILALLIAPSSAFAFTDGEEAVNVLGTYDATDRTQFVDFFTKNEPWDKQNVAGLDVPFELDFDSSTNRLYVADFDRVLVYNVNANGTVEDIFPDFILGDPNLNGDGGADDVTSQNIERARGIVADEAEQLLYVADSRYNRVLVFDVTAITNGEAAVNVLGQEDFTSSSANTDQDGLDGPIGLALDEANDRLFVSDSDNNRIMVFDVSTITDGEDAVNVLGQADFVSSGEATTATGLDFPRGLDYNAVNDTLYVAEFSNNRVVAYDVATITNGEAAANVLGQTDFVTATSGSASNKFDSPADVKVDATGTYAYVADSDNHRVSRFEIGTFTDGEGSVNVLGQENLSDNTAATDRDSLNGPITLAFGPNNHLFVTDLNNSRIVSFDIASVDDGEDAIEVLGQTDGTETDFSYTPTFFKGVNNNGGNAWSFNIANDVIISEKRDWIFVTDNNANQLKAFQLDTNHNLVDRFADTVQGQFGFDDTDASTTQFGLSGPRGLAIDDEGDRLFIADTNNNRVLIYDVTVAVNANGALAANVLGQSDFTSSGAATTIAGLDAPYDVAYDSEEDHLYVVERDNSRVVVYDVASITDGEDAIAVLGQENFTSNTQATDIDGLDQPTGLALDESGRRLFVGDNSNFRVMVFDITSLTDGEDAVNVLGQPDFDTSAANTTQDGLVNAETLAYNANDQELYVKDTENSRIMIFDVAAITDGENAINVLGQDDFVTSSGGSAPVTAKSVASQNVGGLFYQADQQRLFSGDLGRIMVWGTELSASLLGGSTQQTISRACQGATIELTEPSQAFIDPVATQLSIAWEQSTCQFNTIRLKYVNGNSSAIIAQLPFSATNYQWTLPTDLEEGDTFTIQAQLVSNQNQILNEDSLELTLSSTELPDDTTYDTSTDNQDDTGTDNQQQSQDQGGDSTQPEIFVPESINADLQVAPVDSEAADFCAENPLIKLPSDNNPLTQIDSAVYYCAQDGKRYVFPNERIYFSWFSSFGEVSVITPQQMAAIPIGGNITYKSTSTLVKLPSENTVYYVTQYGILRPIADEMIAEDLFGPNWADLVDDLSPAFFADYTIGDPLENL